MVDQNSLDSAGILLVTTHPISRFRTPKTLEPNTPHKSGFSPRCGGLGGNPGCFKRRPFITSVCGLFVLPLRITACALKKSFFVHWEPALNWHVNRVEMENAVDSATPGFLFPKSKRESYSRRPARTQKRRSLLADGDILYPGLLNRCTDFLIF